MSDTNGFAAPATITVPQPVIVDSHARPAAKIAAEQLGLRIVEHTDQAGDAPTVTLITKPQEVAYLHSLNEAYLPDAVIAWHLNAAALSNALRLPTVVFVGVPTRSELDAALADTDHALEDQLRRVKTAARIGQLVALLKDKNK